MILYSYLGYTPESTLITSITSTFLVPSSIPTLGGFNINRKSNCIYNSRLTPRLSYIIASILKYTVYLQLYILNILVSVYRGILVGYDIDINDDRSLIYRIEAYCI